MQLNLSNRFHFDSRGQFPNHLVYKGPRYHMTDNPGEKREPPRYSFLSQATAKTNPPPPTGMMPHGLLRSFALLFQCFDFQPQRHLSLSGQPFKFGSISQGHCYSSPISVTLLNTSLFKCPT